MFRAARFLIGRSSCVHAAQECSSYGSYGQRQRQWQEEGTSWQRQQPRAGGWRDGGRGRRPEKFTYSESSSSGGRAAVSRLMLDEQRVHNREPITKDFYTEAESVKQRSQSEIDAWMSEHNITVQGRALPRPVFDFAEAGFPEKFEQKLRTQFPQPTPIQSVSWPIALSGRDLISIAQTGSGKTLAFILPGLLHVARQAARQHNEGPSLLVMLPTRELAQQVESVSLPYTSSLGLKQACLFGGASRGRQEQLLLRGCDIIFATPGRLLDFLDSSLTNLQRCSYLVLDEADRMLDMGFEPQIRKVIHYTRPDRQTLMFSATWPSEVRSLAAEFQNDAAFLNVGSLKLAANHNITQSVEVLEAREKFDRLKEILNKITAEPNHKTLIFVQTKAKADDLQRWIKRMNMHPLCTHGDKSQFERDRVINEFKSGRSQILLATDVAARGLDVDDIKYVINFDYPNSAEDYIHRIGRTGRRNNKGTAITFFTPENARLAADLIGVLEEAKQEVPLELRDLISFDSKKVRPIKRSWRQEGNPHDLFRSNRHTDHTDRRRAGRYDNDFGARRRKYDEW